MVRFTSRRLLALVALLAAILAPASPGRGASPAFSLPSPAALNSILTSSLRPPRDLYALTARLKLHTTTPINPVVTTTPTDYSVGRTDHFYISNNDDVGGYTLRAATLVLKTAHAYFYVQQGVAADLKALARSAATFEQYTYPTDHAIFGVEWTPGVDDDRHITILNGILPSSDLGYFSAEDLFPRAVNTYSNQRKMIYMDPRSAHPGTPSYDSVLAHELQHMIHFHLHPADEVWINEGSSVLAQVLNGYDSYYDQSAYRLPDTQLNGWDTTNSLQHYDAGFLWMLYLYEHFGGARATHAELADNSLSNMALFDDVLAKLGVHQHVDDVFADWVIANFLNDRSLAGGRYGYSHVSLRSPLTSSFALPFTQPRTMHQYAANYVDIPSTGGKAFALRFAGQPTVPLLGTVAPPRGFWWSNRGDLVDTTLTLPPLDLRKVPHATLRYQAWYDLEKDYDYGYVEVSTDGGKTWYAQRTAHTTHTNPNGANIGDGYTGTSCSSASTASHCWVGEHVDLSPFAGKRVLVRFEQVTDDTYNQQGLAVTHVQVPELGFDGDNTRDGWQPAGWVRAGNTLSEHWIVQAVVYGSRGVSVVRMPVGADGRGSLHIPAGSNRVVVAVSPVAPLTTITNSYTLSGGS